ncbi:hypothetical protein [Mesorhizobium sp.]|uniref:hypothetical protein n=1 Tax=Mesorhizobium sp. TaxID=1871066 RepID=UPI0025C57656|nr:hypothetical protein [Mesorhizobium sp.]
MAKTQANPIDGLKSKAVSNRSLTGAATLIHEDRICRIASSSMFIDGRGSAYGDREAENEHGGHINDEPQAGGSGGTWEGDDEYPLGRTEGHRAKTEVPLRLNADFRGAFLCLVAEKSRSSNMRRFN